MKKKILIYSLILFLSLIYVYRCEFSTEPTKFKPRELKWTVDTLAYPESSQTMMKSIWGLSKKEVYVYGHNDQVMLGNIYHFNGKEWEPILLHKIDGGDLSGSFQIKSMVGFENDNIYAVGSKRNHIENIDYCSIIRFDGSTWQEETIPAVKGYVSCIYGDTPDNIWALATGGYFYHYNGVEWSLDTIPHKRYASPQSSLTGISMVGNDEFGYYFFTASRMEDHSSYNHLFQIKNNKITVIDSGDYYYAEGIHKLWMSPSGRLYKSGYWGVYCRSNNSWKPLSSYDEPTLGIHGSSEEDIYVTTWNGKKQCYAVMHYNGEDWYDFEFELGNTVVNDVIVLNNEVFVVGYTREGFPNKTIILHGKP